MLTDLRELIQGFDHAATRVALTGWPCRITPQLLRGPHRPPSLPLGDGAVYVFALSDAAGDQAPAGRGAVLKVGRVGANSGPRFTYQHYSPGSARSTLAGSRLRYRIMWPWLGIDNLDAASVKTWMLTHLDRAHLYVPRGHDEVLAELEVYVRARVGSIFEGAA